MQYRDFEKYHKKAKDSLRLPEDYFAHSRQRLLSLAESENEKESVFIYLHKNQWQWYLAVAAVLVAGIFLLYDNTAVSPLNSPANDIVTVTDDQIEEYLLEKYEYSLYEPAVVNEVNFVNLPEDQWLESVSTEEINQSLEERMDETLLYQML